MGSKPYNIIKDLKIDGSMVEIGSQRGDGSTSFLYEYSKTINKKFYTVDFNKDQYFGALQITQGRGAYNMLGEEFLGNIFPLLGEKISFAYLDNFDLVTTDGRDWTRRKELYKSYGLEMNNTNSKIAHMTQALLVEKYSSDNCHILFDDTWIQNGEYEGKGAWAIRPLEQCGFVIQNDIYKGDEVNGLKYGYVLMSRYDRN